MTHLAPQRTFALVFCLSLLGRLDGLEAIEGASAGKQGFRSPVLSRGFVSIDVDVRGAKRLYLVVDDGGDGIGCDWADWAEPRLEGARGTRRLTDLRWKSASAGWGSVRMGRNAGGGPLRIAGKPVEYGIGTHSPSVIEFELPEGYARFKARGGLDNGGTDQGCGSTVSFQVFVDQLPARVTRALRRRGGAGPLDAEESLQELDVHEGLEVTLFAHEPMLVNPTNLDIDARGRVWVTEGVNYRRWKNNQPEGDRIVILEDTDLDGRADRRKVFYQDPSINSALGICVLGKRVIVSCSPNVFVFTDEDGDDRPDSKEVLFSGIGGLQHDHGVHAFVFGPDGKLYFNFGNSGGRLLDGQGKPIVDGAGNIVEARGQPYRQGMVFRCNLDGSGVETLGHNFRNNYEVAVDSFGTLWQSDNDDDGHRGVRINYVMEFGNFGYQDERSGAGWASPRTGMHEEIPRRHWHLNDPGVVPNLLQTGAGSPTGICVYEGRLLPKPFHDQVIHCDAGPNVVRSYPVTRRGAGYTAEILDLVKGRDRWFRPSDVCVAADGSVFIADWYDAGVGGHNMADNQVANTRGRIFRVAPHGHRRVVPPLELSTAAGAVRALQSPNHARRYLAWRALQALGEGAENELLDLWENGDTRARSRALHLLARIPGRETHYVERAVRDAHPEIRVTALRIARERGLDVISHVERLVHDLSPHVRRECAIALRHHDSPEAPRLWTELALQHHAGDRWYLEALGIGAQRQEDAFFAAWLERVGTGWRSPAGRDVVWRSRSPRSSALLARLVRDPETPDTERARYFRAFDSLEGDEKEEALVSLLAVEDPFVAGETLKRLKGFDPKKNERHRGLVNGLLERSRGTADFVALVKRFDLDVKADEILEVMERHAAESAGAEAVRLLLDRGHGEVLAARARDGDVARAMRAVRAMGNARDRRLLPVLVALAGDGERDLDVVGQAVRALARTKRGAESLLRVAESGRLPDEVKPVAAVALASSPWGELRLRAASLLPPPPSKDNRPLPPVADLVRREGESKRGAAHFEKLCMNCHRAKGRGKEFGPDLSEIGDKLGKDALFVSILDPNAGISFNYEGVELTLATGDVVVGIVVSETDALLTLQSAGGIVTEYAKTKVLERRRLNRSIMPTDLQRNLTAQELVDLVEYLARLRR